MRKIIDIDYGSTRYDELLELRYKVLLEPLGLKFLDLHRSKEVGYLHIGSLENSTDKLVGGLILAPVDNENIRLMQVAVDPASQGAGVGRELVLYAEKRSREAGYSKIIMHSMFSVVPFYVKLGYTQDSEPFEENGITFVRMVKDL